MASNAEKKVFALISSSGLEKLLSCNLMSLFSFSLNDSDNPYITGYTDNNVFYMVIYSSKGLKTFINILECLRLCNECITF